MILSGTSAYAIGDDNNQAPPPAGPSGGTSGSMLTAAATTTNIKVTQVSGGSSGSSLKTLAPADPNWEPPACWYEPVATPQQLKGAVDSLKQGGGLVPVTPTLSWARS